MGRRLDHPTTLQSARSHRDAIVAIAAAKGVRNIGVLRYPGLDQHGELELIVDVDSTGRTGLELFELSIAVEALIGAPVVTGTSVKGSDVPTGWWVEPL